MPRSRAGEARVEDDSGPDRGVGNWGPASITDPAISWPRRKGNEPIDDQGGGRPGVVGEQMEVAAADPTRSHRHPGPRRPGELGLGDVDERCREGWVDHVELHGAAPGQRTVLTPYRDRWCVRRSWPRVGIVRVADALSMRSASRGSPSSRVSSARRVESGPAGAVVALSEARRLFRRTGHLADYAGGQFAGVRSTPTDRGTSTA